MLRTLHVANFGVFDDGAIEIPKGLVCVTGETGAGKSLLVDAIKLLLGARAEASCVRLGEKEAVVEAVFDCSHLPLVAEAFAEAGYEPEDGEVTLRRTVGADGRGRVWIQGRLATVRQLRELGGRILSVAGQHAFIGLGVARERLAMLDAHARLREQVAEFARRYGTFCNTKERLAELRARQAERAARQDYLEYVIRQVEAVSPQLGEVEALTSEISVLRGAARLKELSAQVCDCLYEGAQSAHDLVSRALLAAREMARIDSRATAFAERIDALRIELGEVARDTRRHAEAISDDPARMAAVEERLEALKGLARRYGGSVEAALATAKAARDELLALEGAQEQAAGLEQEAQALHDELVFLAGQLTEARTKAADDLSKKVTAVLQGLAMEGASFEVKVMPAELSETGADAVEFMVQTNPGEGSGPVSEVASGGELSRISLAIYSVLSEAAGTPVMVYDEIDAGVSGAVANRMGEVLEKAARSRQVLVVTHHGQIAARAAAHFLVEKQTAHGRTTASIRRLEREDRVLEVARMLGGNSLTAVAHAQELLAQGAQAQ